MAGLVGYGGDPRIVASRTEIERVAGHLGAVGSELVARMLNLLPNPIHRAQVDAAMPAIEYRIHKTRLALAAAAENYFTAEARVAHSVEAIGHALRDHPWLVNLVPKPVLEKIRIGGAIAFGAAQFAPGGFGSQSTRMLASSTDLGKQADTAQKLGLLNDKKVSFSEVASTPHAGVGSLAEIGSRIDEINQAERQIRVDTYVSVGGQRTLLVYLPGTQSFSPIAGSNPFDATTDTALTTDPKNSELLAAIRAAI